MSYVVNSVHLSLIIEINFIICLYCPCPSHTLPSFLAFHSLHLSHFVLTILIILLKSLTCSNIPFTYFWFFFSSFFFFNSFFFFFLFFLFFCRYATLECEHNLTRRAFAKSEVRARGLERDVIRLQVPSFITSVTFLIYSIPFFLFYSLCFPFFYNLLIRFSFVFLFLFPR